MHLGKLNQILFAVLAALLLELQRQIYKERSLLTRKSYYKFGIQAETIGKIGYILCNQ